MYMYGSLFKKIVLLVIVCTNIYASVSTSFGVILVIPKDAVPVYGVYTAFGSSSSSIDITSTTTSTVETKKRIKNSTLTTGVMLGLENNIYRTSITYDVTNASYVDQKRLLFNFDFKIPVEGTLTPVLGLGIGSVNSEYGLNGRYIQNSNGVISLRLGTDYLLSEQKSLVLLLEVTKTISSSSDNYMEDSTFTSYEIVKQSSYSIRLGYNF